MALRRKSMNDTESADREEECARLTGMTESGMVDHSGMSPPQEEDNYSECEYEQELPPPPDGGYGWVIVFASFMANMVIDGIAYTFGIFLDSFAKDFNVGKGTASWIGSLLSGVYLSAGPLVSCVSNKYGCRFASMLGAVIASAAFALCTLCTNVGTMMIVYGFVGGIGLGFIYLPAVVAVSYYFETKRSLATGIAVCGSGFGTFIFAPIGEYLKSEYDWRGAHLFFAGFLANCAVFGALMRPLTYPKDSGRKPLLQRMADEKRLQMERGSIGGSYFIVQLQDGSMEKRMKLPINVDPGVHSSFNLDQLIPGTPITPAPTMAVLPTITEVKIPDNSGSSNTSSSGGSTSDVKSTTIVAHSSDKDKKDETIKEEDAVEEPKNSDDGGGDKVQPSDGSDVAKNGTESKENGDGKNVAEAPSGGVSLLPRNQSQPAFTTHVQGIPKNGSVPFFDRIRKTSAHERFRPTLVPIKNSKPNLNSNGDLRKTVQINAAMSSSKTNNAEGEMWSKIDLDNDSMRLGSRGSMIHNPKKEKAEMVRPLSRKDIFYSGSVLNLPEYQSQKSLQSYRQSIQSIHKYSRERLTSENADPEKGPETCSCGIPDSIKSVLGSMLDMSLMKNPVFVLIGISNMLGMVGLYVPFFYLVDAAKEFVSPEDRPKILSVIGVANTIGRILCGYVADLPWVNALLLNNICLLICSISVAVMPFCTSLIHYVIASAIFGFTIAGFITLTSVVLVDLLGLDKLTNAFGLLILFRGTATIFGIPLAGSIYEATKAYTITFMMAAGSLFAASLISFIAPTLQHCMPEEKPQPVLDILTPIDEDDEEEEQEDDDGEGGVVIPEIIETSPSPVLPKASDRKQEIKQMESVL